MKNVIIVAVFTILLGCISSKKIIRITDGIESSNDFRAVILDNIPKGTTINEAQLFMEQQGFECLLGEENPRTLFCSRHDQKGLFVSQDWMVSFPFEANRVSDVFVKKAFTGF